jgi:formylglycine-generating enzyme required for sulfatase activity
MAYSLFLFSILFAHVHLQPATALGSQFSSVIAALTQIALAEGAAGASRVNPKGGLKYVWIPPGSFVMGCSPEDNECYPDEKPSHLVTITKGFWVGQTEVTVGAYKAYSAATGQPMPPKPKFDGVELNPGWTDDAMPMVDVLGDDAQAFCGWAGGRLPTEAEWEYAARGGSPEARYGPLQEVAWDSDNSGKQPLNSAQMLAEDPKHYWQHIRDDNNNQMHDVGLKRPNAFGLFDTLGNVWEWVSDWYDPDYYQHSPSHDPAGPASGNVRILRGGSWGFEPRRVRVSVRLKTPSTNRYDDDGFRCVAAMLGP